MAVEHLAYGWLIGSVTILLVLLYFTRVLRPVEDMWNEGECELCGAAGHVEEKYGMEVCWSCDSQLLP